MIDLVVLVVVGGLGAAVLALSVGALARAHHDARWGALYAIDAGRSVTWRSSRDGLVGRPDLVRRDRSGRWIPIEVKSRAAPTHGPYRSHLAQLWAYCRLSEETNGRPPPFGILRYSDREFRVAWDGRARAELDRLVRAASGPYDGSATPSPSRCAGCRWRSRCDRRAVP